MPQPNNQPQDAEALRQKNKETLRVWKEKLESEKKAFDSSERPAKFSGSRLQIDKSYRGAETLNDMSVAPNPEYGVTELVIQLITLGSYIDKDNMDRVHQEAGGIAPQDYFFMNILKSDAGSRDDDYQMTMYEGRRGALAAINNFIEKKDRDGVNKFAKNLADYVNVYALQHPLSFDNESQVFYGFYKMLLDARKNHLFDDILKNAEITEAAWNKLEENVAVMDIMREGHAAEEQFVAAPAEPDSPERQELILKMLKGAIISKLPEKMIEGALEKPNEEVTKQLTDVNAFDKYCMPEVKKVFGDNPDAGVINKYKRQWSSVSLVTGMDNARRSADMANGTFQTYMLADSGRRKEYEKRLEELIKHTDVYKKLIKETDMAVIRDSVRGLELEKLKTVEESGAEKAFDPASLATDADRDHYSPKIDVDAYVKIAVNEASNDVKKALSADKTRAENTERDESLHGPLMEQEIKKYAAANNLSMDEMLAYTDGIKGDNTLANACVFAAQSGKEVYVRNPEGGFIKFTARESDNHVDVTAENMQAIPYGSDDYIAERHINRINAGNVKKDGKEAKPGYTEGYMMLEAYLASMKASVAKLPKVTEEFEKMISGMEALLKALNDAYDEKPHQENENRRPVTVDDYKALIKAHETCISFIRKYLEGNPFDQCAQDLKNLLLRDKAKLDLVLNEKLKKNPELKTITVADAIREYDDAHPVAEKQEEPEAQQAQANKPENAPARKNTNEEWKENLKIHVNAWDNIAKIAGSDPDVSIIKGKEKYQDRYNEIKIPVDEQNGITEELIQIVTLGSFIDPEALEKHGFDRNRFASGEYLFMNVLQGDGGQREETYRKVLFESRINAKNALEEHKAGNNVNFDRFINGFADYINTDALKHPVSLSREGQIFNSLYKLALKAAEMPQFAGKFHEDTLKKLHEKVEVMESLQKAQDAELSLADDLKPAGSEERKQLLLDAITGQIMPQLSEKFNFKITEKIAAHDDLKLNVFKFEGRLSTKEYFDSTIMPIIKSNVSQEQIEKERLNENKNYEPELLSALQLVQNVPYFTSVSYLTDVLNDPEMKEKYYNSLHRIIEKSDIFRDMMQTTDSTELKDLLKQVKTKVDGKGVDLFGEKEYSLNNKEVSLKKKPFNVADIPAAEDEKKLFKVHDDKVDEIAEKYIKNIEKQYIDNVTAKTIGVAQKYKSEKVINTAGQLKNGLDVYITRNQLELDDKHVYTENGKTNLKDASVAAVKDKLDIYIKNKAAGITKFTVEFDEDNNVKGFKHQNLPAMVYRKADFISEEKLNDTNAEIASLDMKEASPAYTGTYRMLDAYIAVMKGARPENVAWPAEYNDLVGAMEGYKTAIDALYAADAVTAEGRKNLKEAAEKYDVCMKAYFEKNPYDKLANDVRDAIKADMALLDKYPENVAGQKFAAIVIADRDKNLPQNARKDAGKYLDNVLAHPTRNPDVTKFALDFSTSVIKQYVLDTFGKELAVDPDGKYHMVGDSYLKMDGSLFTPQMETAYINEHRDDILEYEKQKFKDYNFRNAFKTEQVKPEVAQQVIGKEIEGYKLPENGEARRQFSEEIEKHYMDYLIRIKIESRAAQEGLEGKPEREVEDFLDRSGTEEGKRYNREYMESALSKDPAGRKAAYEKMLDYYLKLDLKKYDLNKAEDMLKDPEKREDLFEFVGRSFQIMNVINNAAKAGVDFSDARYEKLHDNYVAIETLASDWGCKLKMFMNPAYEVIDYAQLKQLDGEKLGHLMQQEPGFAEDNMMINYGLGLANTEYTQAHEIENGWNLPETDGLDKFEDRLKHSKLHGELMDALDSTDAELFKLRNELAGNIRKTLGFKRKNSERYKKVIKAIDDYRMAPFANKEMKRQELEEACGEYIDHRGASKTRTKLIFGVGKFAHNLKSQAMKLAHSGHKAIAEKMLENYVETLGKVENGAAKSQLEALGNEKFKQMFTERLADTVVCSDIGSKLKPGEYTDSLAISFDTCMKAVREVTRQDEAYDVVRVDEKVKVNNEEKDKVMNDLGQNNILG